MPMGAPPTPCRTAVGRASGPALGRPTTMGPSGGRRRTSLGADTKHDGKRPLWPAPAMHRTTLARNKARTSVSCVPAMRPGQGSQVSGHFTTKTTPEQEGMERALQHLKRLNAKFDDLFEYALGRSNAQGRRWPRRQNQLVLPPADCQWPDSPGGRGCKIDNGLGFAFSLLGMAPEQVFMGQSLSQDTAAQTLTGEKLKSDKSQAPRLSNVANINRTHSIVGRFARNRPTSIQNLPTSPKSGRHRTNIGRVRKNQVEIAPDLAEFIHSRTARFCPKSIRFAPTPRLSESCPTIFQQSLTSCSGSRARPTPTNSGRVWSFLQPFRTHRSNAPNSESLSDLGQHWTTFGRCRLMPAEVWHPVLDTDGGGNASDTRAWDVCRHGEARNHDGWAVNIWVVKEGSSRAAPP